jgi:hypothetical protein
MALGACSSTVSLYCAINGSPGRSVARIAMVDSRSGDPVRLPQAIRYVAVGQGLRIGAHALGRALSSGLRERARVARESVRRAMEQLQPELEEIMRAHRGDPDARDAAIKRLYEERRVDPTSSCLPQLVAGLAESSVGFAMWTLALRSPLRQGLPERLAGVVFVRVR